MNESRQGITAIAIILIVVAGILAIGVGAGIRYFQSRLIPGVANNTPITAPTPTGQQTSTATIPTAQPTAQSTTTIVTTSSQPQKTAQSAMASTTATSSNWRSFPFSYDGVVALCLKKLYGPDIIEKLESGQSLLPKDYLQTMESNCSFPPGSIGSCVQFETSPGHTTCVSREPQTLTVLDIFEASTSPSSTSTQQMLY